MGRHAVTTHSELHGESQLTLCRIVVQLPQRSLANGAVEGFGQCLSLIVAGQERARCAWAAGGVDPPALRRKTGAAMQRRVRLGAVTDLFGVGVIAPAIGFGPFVNLQHKIGFVRCICACKCHSGPYVQIPNTNFGQYSSSILVFRRACGFSGSFTTMKMVWARISLTLMATRAYFRAFSGTLAHLGSAKTQLSSRICVSLVVCTDIPQVASCPMSKLPESAL